MFCPNCGKQTEDGTLYCDNCGYALQPAVTQPGPLPRPLLQGQYGAGFMGRRKSRKGLVIGLIAGAVVLAAALAAALLLLTGGKSVVGMWYSDDRGEVVEFKSDNSFYLHSVSDDYKGEYTFDKSKGEGTVTLEGYKHGFTLSKDEMNVDEVGTFKKAAGNFDADEFLAQLTTPAPSLTIAPTPEPTPEPTLEPTATIQVIAGQTMTLPFIFGECTGTYTGEALGGLPDGYGTFTFPDETGMSWIYEGYWSGGHMSGDGRTTWEYGFSEEGEYAGDLLNGEGSEYWYDRVYYSGGYLDSTSHGNGTLYSYYEEPIFTGGFSYGFIQEAPEAREARLEPFKSQCAESNWKDMYDACYYESKAYAYVEGTVFDVYEYGTGNEYYCDFLMYVSGAEDTDHILQVFYRMSEGEPYITEGQTVKVWGTTAYLYSYTSEGNEYLTVPTIDAWSVE
jgi:hypothetical protein